MSEFCIVYYCGNERRWSPNDTDLLGPEKAVVNLTKEWKLLYKSLVEIHIFSNIGIITPSSQLSVHGNEYHHYSNFHTYFSKLVNHHLKIIFITWKCSAYYILTYIYNKYGGDYLENKLTTFYDMHDSYIHPNFSTSIAPFVDYVMLKSNFHYDILNKMYPEFQALIPFYSCRLKIIGNGVEDRFFIQDSTVTRDPFSICYVNCWSRGLYSLLKIVFPFLKKVIPQLKLHVIYTTCKTPICGKEEMKQLLKQKDVIDYGRVSIDVVERVKRACSFHLYLSNTISDVDSISVKESSLVGCLPILSDENVFKNRHGLHFSLNRGANSLCQIQKIISDYTIGFKYNYDSPSSSHYVEVKSDPFFKDEETEVELKQKDFLKFYQNMAINHSSNETSEYDKIEKWCDVAKYWSSLFN